MITLRSSGPAVVYWRVQDIQVSPPFSQEWLSIEPRSGILFPGSSIRVKVEVRINLAVDEKESSKVRILSVYYVLIVSSGSLIPSIF